MAVVGDTLPIERNLMTEESQTVRIEDVGPKDKNGHQTFTVLWRTDYSPSKPFPHERAQIFHTDLSLFLKRHEECGTQVEVKI